MLNREELHRLIDRLPEDKLPAVSDLLEKIYEIDDEKLSPEELKEIEAAKKRVAKGEFDTFDDVFGDLGV